MVGTLCHELLIQFYTSQFETLQALLSWSVNGFGMIINFIFVIFFFFFFFFFLLLNFAILGLKYY